MRLSKEGISIETKDYTVLIFIISLLSFLGYMFFIGYISIKGQFPKDALSMVVLVVAWGCFFIALIISGIKWEKQANRLEDRQEHKAIVDKINAEAKKTKAEIEKINAEAEKIKVDTQILKKKIN